MSDIYCKKCGEPWDFSGVYAAIRGREEEADMTKEEAEKFMRGEGCPCCGFGKKCPLCGGSGRIDEEEAKWWNNPEPIDCDEETGELWFKCPKCGGTGKPRTDEEAYYSSMIDVDGEINVLDFI